MTLLMSAGPDVEARPAPAPEQAPVRRRRGVAPKEFGGKPWWRPDAVALLTFWAALQLLIPTRLAVPAAGSAGHPAQLFGVGLLAYWACTFAVPYLTRRGGNPLRRLLIGFGVMTLFIYAIGQSRGLPGVEVSAADRKLIATASTIGVGLFALDLIPSRERLDTLLRRVTTFAMVGAIVGFLQFTTDIDLAERIRIPGLHPYKEFTGFKSRGASDFLRVTGMSAHPIEFSVVMGMALPLAIHYAMHAPPKKRTFRWFVVGAIAAGIPLSVSRSGMLAIAVTFVVLGIAWAPAIKGKAVIATIGALGAMSVAVPGLLGTIRSMFVNWGQDDSVAGRTQDYGIVWDYIGQRPWFGRGPGTFLPSRYIVLDNEFLYTLVTMGWIGVITLVVLLWGGIHYCRRLNRTGGDDTTRHLAQALLAAIWAGLITSFTFDSLSFSMFAGIFFFLFGMVGAVWRLDRAGDRGRNPPLHRPFLRDWRSTEFPGPHPLQRAFPRYSAEHGWRRSTSS
jgi:hypothetical protein